MKLILTSQGTNLESPLDPRFGRARYLVVYDTGTDAFSAVDNGLRMDAAQGAGIQTGKRVVELGAEAVITGHVGPKAFATLQAGNVKVYTGASGTLAEALDRFRRGALAASSSADVEGHWS